MLPESVHGKVICLVIADLLRRGLEVSELEAWGVTF